MGSVSLLSSFSLLEGYAEAFLMIACLARGLKEEACDPLTGNLGSRFGRGEWWRGRQKHIDTHTSSVHVFFRRHDSVFSAYFAL